MRRGCKVANAGVTANVTHGATDITRGVTAN
jgi:hypothetical protein